MSTPFTPTSLWSCWFLLRVLGCTPSELLVSTTPKKQAFLLTGSPEVGVQPLLAPVLSAGPPSWGLNPSSLFLSQLYPKAISSLTIPLPDDTGMALDFHQLQEKSDSDFCCRMTQKQRALWTSWDWWGGGSGAGKEGAICCYLSFVLVLVQQ